tara:strand:+ start:322 stop:483 length:162 start_codon:yes stop_codon:yes gene_type:complete
MTPLYQRDKMPLYPAAYSGHGKAVYRQKNPLNGPASDNPEQNIRWLLQAAFDW